MADLIWNCVFACWPRGPESAGREPARHIGDWEDSMTMRSWFSRWRAPGYGRWARGSVTGVLQVIKRFLATKSPFSLPRSGSQWDSWNRPPTRRTPPSARPSSTPPRTPRGRHRGVPGQRVWFTAVVTYVAPPAGGTVAYSFYTTGTIALGMRVRRAWSPWTALALSAVPTPKVRSTPGLFVRRDLHQHDGINDSSLASPASRSRSPKRLRACQRLGPARAGAPS